MLEPHAFAESPAWWAPAALALCLVGMGSGCSTPSKGKPAGSDNGGAGGAIGQGGRVDGGSAGAGEPALTCLTPFIVPKCATSGCHDPITKEHGMDLSTGSSIYAAWINHNGLDHCGNMLVPRVVPGDPAGSFVMRKITRNLLCTNELSRSMPPDATLEAYEIETVRNWIVSGAPRLCSNMPGTGGTGAGGGANVDGGTVTGSGSGGSATGGTGDDSFTCSATRACESQLICAGEHCSAPWSCVSHFDPVLEHPCPEELGPYCGCDGVTFEAPVTCPDRPYQHPGPCEDGYNCNPYDNVCAVAEPRCEAGQAASIVNDCYASCVRALDCRCEFNWECPMGYQCNRDAWRCVVVPPLDGGT